jgi:transcriptional regulator with XRE-family HTH domain
MKTVSDWIHRHRLSLQEFGALVGVERAHVSRMLNGHRTPSLRLLYTIHEVTGISLAILCKEALGR